MQKGSPRAPPTPCSSWLSLQSPAAHRVLHSFPTRRSSDLFSNAISKTANPISKSFGSLSLLLRPPCSMRSEEHTSELQSHSDLVCRLLLEKKRPFPPAALPPSPASLSTSGAPTFTLCPSPT